MDRTAESSAAVDPQAVTTDSPSTFDTAVEEGNFSAFEREANRAAMENSPDSKEPSEPAPKKQQAKAAPAPEAGNQQESQKGKKSRETEERFQKLLGDNKTTRDENERLKARLAEMEKGSKPADSPAAKEGQKTEKTEASEDKRPAKPNAADKKYADAGEKAWDLYEKDLEDYHENLADWKVRQALKDHDAKQQESKTKAEQEERQRKAAETWNARKAAAAAKHSDLEESLNRIVQEKLFPDNGVLDVFCGNPEIGSEIGLEVAYHLEQNRDELKRILEMKNPFDQGDALKSIERQLKGNSSQQSSVPEKKTPSTTTVSKAKPHAEVGGKATPPADEEDAALAEGDFARFEKSANARSLRNT